MSPEHSTAMPPLPSDVPVLQEMLLEAIATIRELRKDLALAQHRLDHVLRQKYGPKAETVDAAQLALFALPETMAMLETPTADPPARPTPTPRPRERKGRKTPLERRRELLELPEHERLCECCALPMEPIRELVTEQWDYQKAAVFIRELVRLVYACKRGCQSRPTIAPKPSQPIDKGRVGPGLLAYVVNSKYSESLPLYRQEGILRRQGLDISRSTMCGWIRGGAALAAPVVAFMRLEVLRSFVVATDDTPLVVLDRVNGGTFKGRIWVYCGDVEHPYLVYDYTPTRERDGPARFLADYEGNLQADACSVYDGLYTTGRIRELGCMMHCRRYFVVAAEVDPLLPMQVLGMIRVLYRVEATCRGMTPDERHAYRKQHAVPVLDQLEEWLERMAPVVPPKSPIGEAIRYARNQWKVLRRYTEDGRFEPDNGRSERALRLVAINRKNWLFAGAEDGGRWAATFWSLIGTCRLHDLDPEAYLRDLFQALPTHPINRIGEWTPLAWAARRRAASVA